MKKPGTYVLAFLATIGLLVAATPTVSASDNEQITPASETSTGSIGKQKQVVAPVLDTVIQEKTEFSEQQLGNSPEQNPARLLNKQVDQQKASESLGKTG